jgi:predicted unusual protein kinase regulating ubiquinone biosynthesis (AarF/ABC1/UbiB family)
MNYNELYSDVNVNASLTTIKVKENVVIDNCWFALAMTIAPGIPLSKLLETDGENNLSKDTIYRAYLHRCFDLLIYKFFSNIIINGFYHGDLHAGNVYFSFTNEPVRKAEITLIDFGAVGKIDLFNDDSDINDLIKIIIQSIFYNYHNLFDTLTNLLNKKSINSITIDKTSDYYKKFKKHLKKIGIKNIYNANKNSKISEIYTNSCLTSKIRIDRETSININNNKKDIIEENNNQHAKCYSLNNNSSPKINENNILNQDNTFKNSIESLYDYVDIQNSIIKNSKMKENNENTEPLPAFDCNINTSTGVISFTEIMNMMMEFYSKSNVNIPITIPDLYELLKAYILINSLSTQINYDSLRMSIILGKILYDYNNIGKVVTYPLIVLKMYNIYKSQYKKYNNVLEKINYLQNKKNLYKNT